MSVVPKSEAPNAKVFRDSIGGRVICNAATATIILVAILQSLPSTHTGSEFTTTHFDALVFLLTQAVTLTSAITVALLCLSPMTKSFTVHLSSIIFCPLPVLVVANSVMIRWVDLPLFSSAGLSLMMQIPGTLLQFTTVAMLYDVGIAIAGSCIYLMVAYCLPISTTQTVRSFSKGQRPILAAWITLTLSVGMCLLCHATLQRMAKANPSKNLLGAFGLLQHEQNRFRSPVEMLSPERETLSQTLNAQRMNQQLISILPESPTDRMSDIVIVILESFREELISPEVMPWLGSKLDQSLVCNQHFSSGNASNHGIFSIMNGLDATWFQQPVTHTPILNRLFKQAGYEIGFFGSKADWRDFLMDGFINQRVFDVYKTRSYRGVRSDRDTLADANRFLADGKSNTNPPKLAIIYLYSTHAIYESYIDDQVFFPTADDRLRYPYAPEQREQVWNRYRNSARTVDRLLSSLESENKLVLVTGDHGEAFLEDSTIGHGSKISRWQNRTPAIIFGNGVNNRVIDSITTHADLLPTLLAISGLAVNQPSTFEGNDLTSLSKNEFKQRITTTRNYLDNRVALLGQWTLDPDQPFAIAIDFSIAQETISLLGALGEDGSVTPSSNLHFEEKVFRKWLGDRFNLGSESEYGNRSD